MSKPRLEKLVVSFDIGTDIKNAIPEAIELAARKWADVSFEHNGRTVLVSVKSLANDIYQTWLRSGKRRSK